MRPAAHLHRCLTHTPCPHSPSAEHPCPPVATALNGSKSPSALYLSAHPLMYVLVGCDGVEQPTICVLSWGFWYTRT